MNNKIDDKNKKNKNYCKLYDKCKYDVEFSKNFWWYKFNQFSRVSFKRNIIIILIF